jgi:hypothetical protein
VPQHPDQGANRTRKLGCNDFVSGPCLLVRSGTVGMIDG